MLFFPPTCYLVSSCYLDSLLCSPVEFRKRDAAFLQNSFWAAEYLLQVKSLCTPERAYAVFPCWSLLKQRGPLFVYILLYTRLAVTYTTIRKRRCCFHRCLLQFCWSTLGEGKDVILQRPFRFRRNSEKWIVFCHTLLFPKDERKKVVKLNRAPWLSSPDVELLTTCVKFFKDCVMLAGH